MKTPEEMNWFLRGGKRPEPAPKEPVVCQNCGGDNLADEEQCAHCDAPLQDGITAADPDQKTYLVKVSQVKKCLWEGYVEIIAGSRLEALVKAKDEFDHCGLDSWDLVDPELGSEDGSDDEPVFSVEES